MIFRKEIREVRIFVHKSWVLLNLTILWIGVT
jgi:hypothetical protein